MSAGDAFQYLWADGVKIKKPIKVICFLSGIALDLVLTRWSTAVLCSGIR